LKISEGGSGSIFFGVRLLPRLGRKYYNADGHHAGITQELSTSPTRNCGLCGPLRAEEYICPDVNVMNLMGCP